MKKSQFVCSAAFVALAALSGVSRADDNSTEGRSEDGAAAVTCAQASQQAWFMHELEQTDGSYSNTVDVPVECQRELIAKDAEVLAAIHAAVANNE